MRQTIYIGLFFICLALNSIAQEALPNGKQTIYFDADYSRVSDKSKATYYCVINLVNNKISNPSIDYYMSGTIHWKGDVVSYETNSYITNGLCTWYDEQGKKQYQVTVSSNVWNGKYCEWWPNGNIKEESNYTNGKKDGCEYKWDENGRCVSGQLAVINEEYQKNPTDPKYKINCDCVDKIKKSYSSKTGYHVNVRFTDQRNVRVYLVHYYGKARPTIFISDSTYLDNNGVAQFTDNSGSFVGGLYIILLGDKDRTNFEFLLNKGDDISITATKSELPNGVIFKNSLENEQFEEYIKFISSVKQSSTASKQLTDYRDEYVINHPNTLLGAIFHAMKVPNLPKTDQEYKTHFWDDFDFKDDRLIFTPLYDAKLKEYFNDLVLINTENLEKEGDFLLKKSMGTTDMFHYTLWWLTKFSEDKVKDEVFVYLVDNYYRRGYASWLTNDELQKYYARADKIR